MEQEQLSNILVVDDNPANLDLLLSALEELPCRIRPSAQPEMALRSAIAHPPDLILLDIRMPKMDGFEFYKNLRENPETANIPVIFLSAMGESHEIQAALDLGAAGYLVKPIDISKMLSLIEQFI